MPRTSPTRLAILLASIAGVLLIGLLDWASGSEFRVFPLYFLPVALAAWHLSRWTAQLLAFLSAVGWLLANIFAGQTYSNAYVWPVNFTTQWVAFGVVGGLAAELRRRLSIAHELGRSDPLTGLPNRRAFEEHALLLLTLATRGKRPLTFAYLDLDHFKQMNDGEGHEAGDRALELVAALMRSHFRASDLLCRRGGDEFAVVLFDTGPEDAAALLERFRQRLEQEMRDRVWPITASIGAVSYPQTPPSLAEVLDRADALMYRAKAAGRNQVALDVGT